MPFDEEELDQHGSARVIAEEMKMALKDLVMDRAESVARKIVRKVNLWPHEEEMLVQEITKALCAEYQRAITANDY